ncbi:MAG TPA: sulfatase-like hydrolase/transferase [Gemmatimonadales bacterium]
MPLYPLLAAVYFVLHLAADNGSELIPLTDLVRPLAGQLAACLTLWALAAWATGGVRKAAPLALAAIAGFSTFGMLASALQTQLEPIGGQVGLLVLLAYFLAMAALAGRRSGRAPSPTTTRYLNIVTGLLAFYSAIRIATDTSLSQGVARAVPVRPAIARPAEPRRRLPDIYLILLDKYEATRMLGPQYGLDNRPFEDSLRARGFLVPGHAQANYVHTSLALAAMLNFDYLDDLPKRFGVDNQDWKLIYPMIENNQLAAFLRSRGYRYVFFPSAFAPTRQSRIADAQLPSPSQIRPEFESVWLWTTPMQAARLLVCSVVRCRVYAFSYAPESADLLDWKLAQLPELAGGEQPVFSFAHLALPHEPYVYYKSCAHRQPYWPLDDAIDTLTLKRAYVEQIECLNRKLLVLVDALQRRSSTPPIILLQSDHGHGRLGRLAPSLEAVAPWQVAERRAVFAAYALPGVPPDEVSDSITPVNIIRLVLRHYFKADLPNRPDVTYWSGWTRPYRFTRLQ